MQIADVCSTVHTVYCAHCISFVHKLEKQGIRALLNPCVRRIGTTQNYVNPPLPPHTLSPHFKKSVTLKDIQNFSVGSEAWKLNYERQRFVTQHAVKTLKASFKHQRSDLSHMYGPENIYS